ncbi:CIA30 family protein [Prosthecochloris sp. SCSIO W1101]|nr:CIA30 family protein [Prosthecochloris sp. SCSIO W1101]
MGAQRKIITDFIHPPLLRWTSVNDGVMGGLSDSLMQRSGEGKGVFSGHLSLENNGGFTSVRALLPENDFSGYHGIELYIKGDGKRYSFRLRTDLLFDGLVYRQEFDAPMDRWMAVQLPFSDFKPSFRGRTVFDALPLDPARIFQIGFLLSEKQAGAFRLEVARIEVFQS